MIPLLLGAVGVYLGIGLGFALPFVFLGVQRVDPDAAGAGVGFRLLIVPGVVLLWPLLARRWWRDAPPPRERTPHKRRLEAR